MDDDISVLDAAGDLVTLELKGAKPFKEATTAALAIGATFNGARRAATSLAVKTSKLSFWAGFYADVAGVGWIDISVDGGVTWMPWRSSPYGAGLFLPMSAPIIAPDFRARMVNGDTIQGAIPTVLTAFSSAAPSDL